MKKKQIECNHRLDDNSRDALNIDPETGYATCQKCKARFKLLDVEKLNTEKVEQIEEMLNQIDDLLNTLKLISADSPELMHEIKKQCKAAHKLRKLPELTRISANLQLSKEINFKNYFSSMGMFNNLSGQNMKTVEETMQNILGPITINGFSPLELDNKNRSSHPMMNYSKSTPENPL